MIFKWKLKSNGRLQRAIMFFLFCFQIANSTEDKQFALGINELVLGNDINWKLFFV